MRCGAPNRCAAVPLHMSTWPASFHLAREIHCLEAVPEPCCDYAPSCSIALHTLSDPRLRAQAFPPTTNEALCHALGLLTFATVFPCV
jgi:hypothetical protein